MKLPDIRFDESNADYHADTEYVGHSMKENFLKSPPSYNAYFVDRTESVPEATVDQLRGSLTHAITLEGDLLKAGYMVAPEGVTRRQNKWADLQKAAVDKGKALATHEDYLLAAAMAEKLLAHPWINKFFAARHHRECSIRWRDEVTGLVLKCRPDILVDDSGRFDKVIVCDLKTATDPSPWGFAGIDEEGRQRWGQVHKLGYHRQAAHYIEGVRQIVGGQRPIQFVWLAVGNKWPHDIWRPYYAADALLRDGQLENQLCADRLLICLQTGNWSPCSGEALEVGSTRREYRSLDF